MATPYWRMAHFRTLWIIGLKGADKANDTFKVQEEKTLIISNTKTPLVLEKHLIARRVFARSFPERDVPPPLANSPRYANWSPAAKQVQLIAEQLLH